MAKKIPVLIACMVGLSGCASVETRLPQPDTRLLATESGVQEQAAFVRYLDMLDRLDRISARVLQANAELCEKTVPDIGVKTHTTKSYPKHLRDSAARYIGAGETPSILLVREGSVGDVAGLTVGDVLVDADGDPSHFPSKPVVEMLTQSGEIRKRVANDNGYETLAPAPSTSCGYPVNLKFSTAINAYANGKAITVTTGMMEFTERDEELALIVGHELAHNTMRHVPKSIRNLLLSGFATRTTRLFESEADYVGLYYMARAGFELDGVEDFWRRLGVISPKAIVRAKTHPMTPDRLLSIRASAQEIKDKIESGETLVPNYLNDKDDADGS